jgi:hypothetical protein
MAEMNSIYDKSGNQVGQFRFGVAWSKNPRVRLGEYDDDFVYGNDGTVLAKIGETAVVDIIGDTIGSISSNELFISNENVGTFIGSNCSGAAALVLIFSKYAVKYS